MKVKICILQFERAANYKKCVEKAKSFLEEANKPDFALIGGEFSLKESKNTNPYPPLVDLARSYNCNVIAPINANMQRFPNLKTKGFSSMHIFDRNGEVIAIQDKQNFYPKEKPWFKAGTEINIFEVEKIKIGLIRGLDILFPEYTKNLKEAEIVFFSTMAVDDILLEAAKVQATENQNYVVMSSFIGKYVGLDFVGNAAFITPYILEDEIEPVLKSKTLEHLTGDGLIENELDIEYIKKLKKDYLKGGL